MLHKHTSYSNSFGRFIVTLTEKTMLEMKRALGLAFMGLQMVWYLLQKWSFKHDIYVTY